MTAIPDRQAGGLVMLGRVKVDLAAERFIDPSGRDCGLRPQAFAVLRHLIANPGRLVTKDELMQAVWPGVAVTDDSLVQCIGEIRRALGEEGKAVIETVPRRGYRLVLPHPPGTRARPSRKWLALAMALIAAVAVTLFGGTLRAVRAPAAAPVVAVLPFEDLSPDGSLGHLSEGVAEDIIVALGRAPEVQVIARNSSFAFDSDADPREVGRDLAVRYVVEGSVRRDADGLRIGAQLVDAANGRQVWGERYDRTGEDPNVLTDGVVEEIIGTVAGVDGKLRSAEYAAAWGKDTASLGEYDYAMRALSVMRTQNDAAGNARTDAIIREGLAKYPDSTHLKIKLAWNDWRRAYSFWSTDMQADFESAARGVREVLATPNLPPMVAAPAHSLRGYVAMRDGDYAMVRREAELVAALAPHDPSQLTDLAETLVPAGDYEKALAYIAVGDRLNPAEADYRHGLKAWIARLKGDLPGSARESAAAGSLWPYQRLQYAITLTRLGRTSEAREQVAKALAEDPDFDLEDWEVATFYADPSLMPRELADLAAAGLPEGPGPK